MNEVVLQKALSCRDRIAKIRSALPADAHDVRRDERLEAFLSFNIFLLLQDTIALAARVVSLRGLGVPASQRETFEVLTKAGLIRAETAASMAAATALRNRIAHAYGDLDPVRLVAEAPAGLAVVESFLDEITPSLV